MVTWAMTHDSRTPPNINGYLHSRNNVGSSSRRSVRRRFFGSMIPMRNVTAASEPAVIFNGLGHQGLTDASGIGICWVMSGNEIFFMFDVLWNRPYFPFSDVIWGDIGRRSPGDQDDCVGSGPSAPDPSNRPINPSGNISIGIVKSQVLELPRPGTAGAFAVRHGLGWSSADTFSNGLWISCEPLHLTWWPKEFGFRVRCSMLQRVATCDNTLRRVPSCASS